MRTRPVPRSDAGSWSDDALAGQGPHIEELEVPARSVRGTVDWRPITVLTVVAAVVAYGVIGAFAERQASTGANGPDLRASFSTAAASASPSSPAPPSRARVILPAAGATVNEGAVSVLADVPSEVHRVVVEVRLGEVVVGSRSVRPVRGRVRTDIVVVTPGAGVLLPVDVVIDDVETQRELARRSIVVGRDGGTTVDADVVSLPSGGVQLQLSGTTRLVNVEVLVTATQGTTTRSATARVRAITQGPLADGARVLGVGRWLATFLLPAGTEPISVRVGTVPEGTELGSAEIARDGYVNPLADP